MEKNKLKEMLMLPFGLWFAYMIVALIIGYTPLVNTSVDLLIGNLPVYFAVLFGLWVGARTLKQVGSKPQSALLSGFILSLAIGAISVLFLLLLAQTSGQFAQAYGSLSSTASATAPTLSLTELLESAVSSWVSMVLLTMVGSVLGMEFLSRK